MNLTNVNNNITVNDMFYMMLHLTPEFSSLMFDKQDILDNIHHFNQMAITVNRVYDEEVLKSYRRESIREVSETNGTIRMEERFK